MRQLQEERDILEDPHGSLQKSLSEGALHERATSELT